MRIYNTDIWYFSTIQKLSGLHYYSGTFISFAMQKSILTVFGCVETWNIKHGGWKKLNKMMIVLIWKKFPNIFTHYHFCFCSYNLLMYHVIYWRNMPHHYFDLGYTCKSMCSTWNMTLGNISPKLFQRFITIVIQSRPRNPSMNHSGFS